MAKKRSFVPGILFSMPTPQPTTVVGGGTGQSTTDPFACDYDTWLSLFAVDYNGDGFDHSDYRMWFEESFGDEAEDLWKIYNDDPWVPNPNIVPMPVTVPTESPIPMVEPSIEP